MPFNKIHSPKIFYSANKKSFAKSFLIRKKINRFFQTVSPFAVCFFSFRVKFHQEIYGAFLLRVPFGYAMVASIFSVTSYRHGLPPRYRVASSIMYSDIRRVSLPILPATWGVSQQFGSVKKGWDNSGGSG